MKRTLIVVAAVTALATTLAFTVSPTSPRAASNTPAPRNTKKAQKILRADVMKLAHDYSHKRYRAVCSDMTRSERGQLGGTSQCSLAIAALYALAPVKKFTITTAKLGKRHLHAAVSVYVDGNKKHVVHAFVKWEGGAYRLDHQSGWHPKI